MNGRFPSIQSFENVVKELGVGRCGCAGSNRYVPAEPLETSQESVAGSLGMELIEVFAAQFLIGSSVSEDMLAEAAGDPRGTGPEVGDGPETTAGFVGSKRLRHRSRSMGRGPCGGSTSGFE